MDYDAYDAILHFVFKQTQGDAWFKPSEENVSAGVCLRVEPGHFRVFPYENPFLQPFEEATRLLNPVIAVKVRSAAVHAALNTISATAGAIQVDSATRIQVLESMAFLPQADKEQCGAFIRDERVLVVWSDELDSIIPFCTDFQQKLIQLVWRHRMASPSSEGSLASPTASQFSDSELAIHEKTGGQKSEAVDVTLDSLEKGSAPTRPKKLYAAVYTGLAGALSLYFIGNGVNSLITESILDGQWVRFALLALAPLLFSVSLFFSLQTVNNVSFAIGPVAQYYENSKYYSAVKPKANKRVDMALPHITIEMPVYKESLEQTIAPSVYSLKKAMQTYARQGGTSAIFVHDDGLQLITPEERKARMDFYSDHNIGWVARPAHNGSDPAGFKRAGRFKKASNMNYGLALSLRMEKILAKFESGQLDAQNLPGKTIEDKALGLAVDETFAESGQRWKPWANNGRSCRIGEIILIVDSDTVVPEDCFRDAAREMAESPEVAVIQHESDVMQVAHNYFENGIAYFTRRINKCISMSCANGEVAPFVGHNAFLRWSAVQEASFIDPADDVRKIWSESNVSEDFDMALRLQLQNYTIRWATYSEGGFKEGVSLTADDELNRWQKYAYGSNELIFNPLASWFRKGPISAQLRLFLWSDAPIHYKFSMMAYMFSYYGIAAGFTLSLLNYLVLGWGNNIDGFYMHSFEIWLSCMVVFQIAGNVGFTLLEYRLGQRGLVEAFFQSVVWIPFFFFFFGGISIHLSTALLAHLLSVNITWDATKKEVERSNFFIEIPRIFKRFWVVFLVAFITIAAIVVLALPFVPAGWRIPTTSWGIIFPIALSATCHFLFPLVLNPYLMVFSY